MGWTISCATTVCNYTLVYKPTPGVGWLDTPGNCDYSVTVPYRRNLIVEGNFYHIFNRSVARQPVFNSKDDYIRAIESLLYYNFQDQILSFSHYSRLPVEIKEVYRKEFEKHQKVVQIVAYCLMPNHFHLLVKETQKGGVSYLMRCFQNSYAKYFNTKTLRSGALFQEMFKAVVIETEEQLLHVARYINLNPLTSGIVRDFQEAKRYKWSSLKALLENNKNGLVDTSILLSFLKTPKRLEEFTTDQADYQRKLHIIKHLQID